MILYTIGHSNITIEDFIKLLCSANIEVLVDVRSAPYSKYASQFNKENLIKLFQSTNIKYVYMGDLIGGIPKDKSYYVNGKIDYNLVKEGNSFKSGINRLRNGIKQYLSLIHI
ncbi:MAG: DUF488 domain-containing protein, partial [Thermodesulfovibrionales bacterium]|nr:DUF488 domain-containing protein [Thermodesulfovibrionales bacterium]